MGPAEPEDGNRNDFISIDFYTSNGFRSFWSHISIHVMCVVCNFISSTFLIFQFSFFFVGLETVVGYLKILRWHFRLRNDVNVSFGMRICRGAKEFAKRRTSWTLETKKVVCYVGLHWSGSVCFSIDFTGRSSSGI